MMMMIAEEEEVDDDVDEWSMIVWYSTHKTKAILGTMERILYYINK